MTTSRIVRGTKARIFLYICAVLIITGIIACYNNTLSQLEDARKSNEICHQQEENLSTQLQVISDYKQRLEKSLKTEKAEHQQVKNDLENKLNEEKSRNEKATNEANLRFSSLQQHFNMLQTQYEDLQTKLKEMQDEFKEVKASKESLKSKYIELQSNNEHLQSENEELQRQLNQNKNDGQNEINHLTKENHELKRELEGLRSKCSAYESIQPPQIPQESSSPRNAPNFNKQVQVDSNAYKIKMEEKNPDKNPDSPQVDQPRQILSPPNQNYIKTPSKSTTTSSVNKVSKGSLNGARPLLIPTVTPKGAKVVPPLPYQKKLPDGVVPVPEKRDVEKKTDDERNELPEENINNRYRNKINDIALKEDAKKAEEADKENVAHEVFDQHANYDNLGFGEVNDPVRNAEKQNFNKHHIDQLGIDGNKAYENDENQQIEENEPEDDDPDYAEHIGRIKDPVVRN